MLDWQDVLRAFSALGVGVSRHPDDLVRGTLPIARQLTADGLLARNLATGYFALTTAGQTLAVALGLAE